MLGLNRNEIILFTNLRTFTKKKYYLIDEHYLIFTSERDIHINTKKITVHKNPDQRYRKSARTFARNAKISQMSTSEGRIIYVSLKKKTRHEQPQQ